MPNYLRHVCAQYLIEYCDLSWKHGFEWFDYTLIDTDVAINAHMWQQGGCRRDLRCTPASASIIL